MKKLIRMIILSFFTLAVLITASFAWFTNADFIEPNISGYSVAAYFGGGDGSTNDPFKIKNARHLYNLAWLQYLGYFNKKGSGITENQNATTLTQFSFSIEQNIDMSGWVLPPIGTSYNPFIGKLDGNGYTISNLQTTNRFSDFGQRHPSAVTAQNFANVEMIGFMGAVGTTTTMNHNDCSINTSANELTSLLLNNTTVDTYIPSLLGSVAGYVNGTIEDVGVRLPTLNVNTNAAVEALASKTTNISDYAVVGYAESEYTTAKTKRATTVYNPTTSYSHFNFTGMGDNNDWGGSIDMNSLYKRINTQIGDTALPNYVTNEIRYYEDGVLTNKTHVTQTTTISNYYYKSYNGGTGAYLTQDTAPTSNKYDYLTALYKDVILVNKTSTTVSGYSIKEPSGNFLNFTSTRAGNNSVVFNGSLTVDTDEDTATIWAQESRGTGFGLYTYNEDDGNKFYINATTSGLSISKESNTTWYLDTELQTYYILSNNVKYYLKYINGWTVSNKKSYYIIDDQGHYLTRNGTYVTNGTQAQATRWCFSVDGTNPSGLIYDELSTNNYLYINNNTLRVGNNTNTTWENNGINFKSNSGKYLKFDGTNWVVYTPDRFFIKYNLNYLSVDENGNMINISMDDEPVMWAFTDMSESPRGIVSTVIDDVTYYLAYNNGLTISTTIQTNWSNDGNGLYVTINDTNYYVQYKNSSWQAVEPVQKNLGFGIVYNNTYLSVSGTTVTGVSDYNDAAGWYVDENNYVYTYINDTKYYLYANRSDVASLTTNLNQTSGSNYGYGVAIKQNNYIYERDYSSYTLIYDGKSGWKFSSGINQLSFPNIIITDLENTPVGQLYYANMADVSQVSLFTNSITRTSSNLNVYENPTVNEPSVFNYIPLNTVSNNTVKDTNTGYIMSGGHSGTSGDLDGVDIRVAGEATSYNIKSRLTKSCNNDGTIKANSVYTYDGTLHTINDSSNTYQKYSSSRTSLQDTLTSITVTYNSSKVVSGIHFIDASISTSHLVTAPSVMINGVTYPDYQMPENSIDFQLKQKGFINFFAGLYYPGNTSFFSLHKVERDANQKITAINHIVEIYKKNSDNSADYLYRYKNGNTYSWSDTTVNTSDYTKVFDCTWIESPGFTNNTVTTRNNRRTMSDDGDYDGVSNGTYSNNGLYMTKLFYFEIPVNKGEYALGSVDGRDGGYLLYLDIGANAASVDRTTITQESKTVSSDYKYVNGIQIINASGTVATIDAANSVVAIIPAGGSNLGELSISRTDNTITFSTALNSSYQGDNITTNATLTALYEKTIVKKVLEYMDYNRSMDRRYETVVTDEKTYINGTLDSSLNKNRFTVSGYDKNGDPLKDDQGVTITNPFVTDQTPTATRKTLQYGLLGISNVNGVPSAVRIDDHTTIAINTKEAQEILKYDFVVDTANKNNITEEISMNIVRVTGTERINNMTLDSNNQLVVENYYDISSGKITLTEPQYTQTQYTLEYVYKLAGDDATVTSQQTAVITVRTAEGTYTFTINGTTVGTGQNDTNTVNTGTYVAP